MIKELVKCCFTSTLRNRRLIRDGIVGRTLRAFFSVTFFQGRMSETSAWSLGCYLVRDSPKFALVANGIPEAMQSENPMDKILAQHACTHHPCVESEKV